MLTDDACCRINNRARRHAWHVTAGLHQQPDEKLLLKWRCLQLLARLISTIHICHGSFCLQPLYLHWPPVHTSGAKSAWLISVNGEFSFY